MCLETVTKRYQPPKQEIVTVYKIFRLEHDKLLPMFSTNLEACLFNIEIVVGQSVLTKTLKELFPGFSVGTWLEDRNERNIIYDPANRTKTYPVGWHAFTNKEDAIKCSQGWIDFVVHEVELTEIVVEGTQSVLQFHSQRSINCIVAKKMKIGNRIHTSKELE